MGNLWLTYFIGILIIFFKFTLYTQVLVPKYFVSSSGGFKEKCPVSKMPSKEPISNWYSQPWSRLKISDPQESMMTQWGDWCCENMITFYKFNCTVKKDKLKKTVTKKSLYQRVVYPARSFPWPVSHPLFVKGRPS